MTTIHAGDHTTGCDECAKNTYSAQIEEAGHDWDAVRIYSEYLFGKDLADWEEWIDEFQEAFAGYYDSEREFAEDLADQTGMLLELPENLRYYFDFDLFARDLLMGDYWEHDGYYFRSL